MPRSQGRSTTYERCPASTAGDLQLEVVLTPLLFNRSATVLPLSHHNPAATQPQLHVLDIGCGAARLLGALNAFPPHVVDAITYVGCEASSHLVSQSRRELALLTSDSRYGRLSSFHERAQVFTWQKVARSMKNRFDIAYLVNVLHHVHPLALPRFLMDVVELVRDGGFVVIHDFYYSRPEAIDEAKYCRDSLFLSPRHLTALFSMASTQTGNYRTIERRSQNDTHYDMFTFILHIANELSHQTRSDVNADFLATDDLVGALDVALYDHEKEVHSWYSAPWTLRYADTVSAARAEWLASHPITRLDPLSRQIAVNSLGLRIDPWHELARSQRAE